MPENATADLVVVTKSKHRLELLRQGQVIAAYSVSLGRGGTGPKRFEGDGRTPEGKYTIDAHNNNSALFLSLHVSYPNADDRARADAAHRPAGGLIMVHGMPAKWKFLGRLHRAVDWTNGCIALTNAEMLQVYKAVPDGTQIIIQH